MQSLVLDMQIHHSNLERTDDNRWPVGSTSEIPRAVRSTYLGMGFSL